MKQFLLFSIAAIVFSSCHFTTGSGNIVTEKRNPGQFRGISVGGGVDVELRSGPVTDVVVESDDNIIKYVVTEVSGDVLKVRIKELHNFGSIHLKVYVTAPEISNITASGGADVYIKGNFHNDNRFTFSASGGGSISGDVSAPDIEADASGGASIKLTGKTKHYVATASGGSELKTSDLLSETTIVNASSGSSAHVYASLSLTADASSGANVSYQGGASVQKSVSSGGSVEKRD